MNKNLNKNLFITIMVMLTTLCFGCTNITKGGQSMDNNDKISEENRISEPPQPKPHRKPTAGEVLPIEEIIPNKPNDSNDSNERIRPLAGKVIPPRYIEEQQSAPLAGDVMPGAVKKKESGFSKLKSFFKKNK